MIKKTNIYKVIILFLMIVMLGKNYVQADSFWDTIFNAGDDFLSQGRQNAQSQTQSTTLGDGSTAEVNTGGIDTEELRGNWQIVYNVLFALGIALSVIIGAILGIRLMFGSIEQQVKAKEILIPYVLGCFVIFGSFGLWKLAVTVFSQFST